MWGAVAVTTPHRRTLRARRPDLWGTHTLISSDAVEDDCGHQSAGAEAAGADAGAGGVGGMRGSRESTWNGVPPIT
jgi:hypothetical protein